MAFDSRCAAENWPRRPRCESLPPARPPASVFRPHGRRSSARSGASIAASGRWPGRRGRWRWRRPFQNNGTRRCEHSFASRAMCRSFNMLPPDAARAVTALSAVLIMMLTELIRSRRNERELRRRGAVEPQGDVYRALAVAYPLMFVVMAVEGSLLGPVGDWLLV